MISIAAFSHVGRVRQRNEDTLVLPGLVSAGPVTRVDTAFTHTGEPLLLAVVDGMGGHPGGREAGREVGQHLLDHPGTEIADALRSANRALYDLMGMRPDLAGMGATIAGVRLDGAAREATVFNVGDARVYQFADEYLMLLTVDDRAGADSNIVTQSLGGALRPTDVDPHVRSVALDDAGLLLVCSDGLSGFVSFDEIQSLLKDAASVGSAAELLVQAALDTGAPDNVSVIVAKFGGGLPSW